MRLPGFLRRWRTGRFYTDSDDPRMREIVTAVKRGAALLDEANPEWFRSISVADLHIQSDISCILAQLYGDYLTGLHALGIDHGSPYGFVVGHAYTEHAEDLWRQAIVRRKVASPQDSR